MGAAPTGRLPEDIEAVSGRSVSIKDVESCDIAAMVISHDPDLIFARAANSPSGDSTPSLSCRCDAGTATSGVWVAESSAGVGLSCAVTAALPPGQAPAAVRRGETPGRRQRTDRSQDQGQCGLDPSVP